MSLLTAPWAVLFDAASYLASGLLLLRVRAVEPASRRFSLRGVRGEAAEGLRWVYRHRTLGPYALSTHGWFLVNAVAGATLPLFALRTLGLSPFGLGLALAAGGAGGLLGALSATARRAVRRRRSSSRAAATGMAWAIIASGWHGWVGWVVFGVGEFLLGLTMGTANANEMGYTQTITPDHLQGRTNATRRSINRAMIVSVHPLAAARRPVGYRPMLYAAAIGFGLVSTPGPSARTGTPASTPQRTRSRRSGFDGSPPPGATTHAHAAVGAH